MGHPYRDESPPTGPPCPGCAGSALAETPLADRTIFACPACHGLWIPPAVFNDALIETDLQREGEALDRQPAPAPPPPGRRHCLTCHAPMPQREFAGRSGVLVDACARHGIWLDATEFTRIIEFARRAALLKTPGPNEVLAAYVPSAKEIGAFIAADETPGGRFLARILDFLSMRAPSPRRHFF